MRLDVRDLSVSIGGTAIVRDLSLHVDGDEFVGLLGPNGCGKSTTLKAVYRVNMGYGGTVSWDGVDARRISQRDFARRVAVMGQFNDLAFDFTVGEVVAMGRAPHQGLLSSESDEDREVVREALERVGMLGRRDRSFLSLSGGERQRVVLARALAQRPEFLVLDEPTNHMDVRHQIETLAIARDAGVGCLAALHDLALASHFADRVYLMRAGSLVCAGTPAEVVTEETLQDVYGVRASVTPEDDGGLAISYRYPERGAMGSRPTDTSS